VRLTQSIWNLERLLYGVLIYLSLILQTLVGSRANVTITRRSDAKYVANWEFVIAAALCPRALFADLDSFSISFVSMDVPFSFVQKLWYTISYDHQSRSDNSPLVSEQAFAGDRARVPPSRSSKLACCHKWPNSSDICLCSASGLRMRLYVCSQLQGQIDTGYAETSWTAPLIVDGEYEIAVRVQCASTVGRPLPGLLSMFSCFSHCEGVDSFVSSPIRGRIDRTPPEKFGQGLLPANNKYLPGDEISATFTEKIDCNEPFTFSATLLVESNPVQGLQGSDLSLYCDGNRIVIEISSSSTFSVGIFCFVALTCAVSRCHWQEDDCDTQWCKRPCWKHHQNASDMELRDAGLWGRQGNSPYLWLQAQLLVHRHQSVHHRSPCQQSCTWSRHPSDTAGEFCAYPSRGWTDTLCFRYSATEQPGQTCRSTDSERNRFHAQCL
jgi:hypothetical protein